MGGSRASGIKGSTERKKGGFCVVCLWGWVGFVAAMPTVLVARLWGWLTEHSISLPLVQLLRLRLLFAIRALRIQ